MSQGKGLPVGTLVSIGGVAVSGLQPGELFWIASEGRVSLWDISFEEHWSRVATRISRRSLGVVVEELRRVENVNAPFQRVLTKEGLWWAEYAALYPVR